MADTIRKLTHTAAEVDDNIDEVVAARGEYNSLDERLDAMGYAPSPSSSNPAMDGTANPGTSTDYARSDHVHPTDTSRASATAEAEDRAALVELVDGGAKNICNPSLVSQTLNTVDFTVNSNGTILADSNNTATTALVAATVVTLTDVSGTYVLSGCAAGGTENTYRLDIVDDTSGSPVVVGVDTGDSVQVTLDSAKTYRIRIRIVSGLTISNLLFKPMLCSKAAWDISHAYQPYRPSYQELYERVVALEQGQ